MFRYVGVSLSTQTKNYNVYQALRHKAMAPFYSDRITPFCSRVIIQQPEDHPNNKKMMWDLNLAPRFKKKNVTPHSMMKKK
jgi:hypothetical protein